jgi:outer membrane protein TolC
MKQLISDSIEGLLDIRVEVTPPEKPVSTVADARKDFAQALSRRPDYQSALLGIDIDQLALERDRRRRLPSLALVGSMGYDSRGSSIGGSVSNLGSSNTADSYSLETVFSMPIPNRRDRSQYAISQINLDQSKVGLEQLKQIILLRLDDAARRVGSSWERIQVTQ